MRDCFTPGDAKLHLTQARFVLPNFIETGMNISTKNCFINKGYYKYGIVFIHASEYDRDVYFS